MAGTAYDFIEKGRISALQLFFLVITFVIATADVVLPAYVYQEAGRDSWISVIIGTLSSLLLMLIVLKLGLKYPGKTLLQYSCDILGRPLGKVVGFIYIYYFIGKTKAVTRELSEILVTAFNPETPLAIYSLITLLVALYAVSEGLEVIARLNQVLLPLGFFIIIFITIVNIPEMDLKNYLPILAEGVVPPLRGALLIQSWLLESFVVLQLIPYVREQERIKKYVLVSILVISLGLMFGVSIIAVFGPLTGRLLYPALEFVRYGKIGKYIQNLDITIMGLWITGIFIKIALFIYLAFHGIVQLLELRDGKRLLLPLVLLIFAASVSTPRILEPYQVMHYIVPIYIQVPAVIIPLLLLVVSLLRGTAKNTQRSQVK
jgi:spore germination protein KB